jgi:hypothetical protein
VANTRGVPPLGWGGSPLGSLATGGVASTDGGGVAIGGWLAAGGVASTDGGGLVLGGWLATGGVASTDGGGLVVGGGLATGGALAIGGVAAADGARLSTEGVRVLSTGSRAASVVAGDAFAPRRDFGRCLATGGGNPDAMTACRPPRSRGSGSPVTSAIRARSAASSSGERCGLRVFRRRPCRGS